MMKTILVALDLDHGDHNDKILRLATQLAQAENTDLTLLTVIPAAPANVAQFFETGYETLVAERSRQTLEALADGLGIERERVLTEVRFGAIYREIIACAEHLAADLIVVGSHAPHAGDFLLGSNAARVVRHAACSVYVVR